MHRVTSSDISFIMQNYRKNKFGGTMTLTELAAKIGVSINTIQDILHMRSRFRYLQDTDMSALRQTDPKEDFKAMPVKQRKQMEYELFLNPYDSYFMALQKENAFVKNSEYLIRGIGLVHIQRILIFAIRRDYLNWDKELTEEEMYTKDLYGNTLYSDAALAQQLYAQMPDKDDLVTHIHLARYVVKNYEHVQKGELILPSRRGSGIDRFTGEHCSCYYQWSLSNKFKEWLDVNNFIGPTSAELRKHFQCYTDLSYLKSIKKDLKLKTLEGYL